MVCTASDIGIVIPTFNRPDKLDRLLDSLAHQTNVPAEVVVVSAGECVRNVVDRYTAVFRTRYDHLAPGGQIAQRNRAITLLSQRIRIVISFDDDIVCLPDSIESIIAAWKRAPEGTAGIGFNMINEPPFDRSSPQVVLGIIPNGPGKVSAAGVNSSLSSVRRDLRTEWLPGGATSWRFDIVQAASHKPIDVRWAAAEDLMFSYPIGRKSPLLVAHDARVRHLHDQRGFTVAESYERGRTFIRMRGIFVNQTIGMKSVVHRSIAVLQGFLVLGKGLVRMQGCRVSYGIGMVLEGVGV